MKHILAAALFMLGAVAGVSAQTVQKSDTFTFATGAAIARWTVSPACGGITAWDGVANAYPEDMGGVCITQPAGGGYGSSIDVPFQLGYLNNGSLDPCDHINLGPKVFTVGDGTHTGDQFTVSGSTTCPYFTGEYGTYENSNNRLEGFSVVATYTVFRYIQIVRGAVVVRYNYILTSGTGTVADSVIN